MSKESCGVRELEEGEGIDGEVLLTALGTPCSPPTRRRGCGRSRSRGPLAVHSGDLQVQRDPIDEEAFRAHPGALPRYEEIEAADDEAQSERGGW